MKNLIILLVLIVCFGCNKEDVSCPVVVGPRGMQFLVSFESAKKLCENRIKYVTVEKTTQDPVVTNDYFGNVFETTKNDSAILIAVMRENFAIPDSGHNFRMFKSVGPNSYYVGFEELHKIYYTLNKDSALEIIGYRENNVRLTADSLPIVMTKGTDKNDFYTGSSYGEIYKAKGEKEFEQIGTFDYFWLPASENPDGFQRAILMTKGLGKDDKWCGEMDGIIYIGEQSEE